MASSSAARGKKKVAGRKRREAREATPPLTIINDIAFVDGDAGDRYLRLSSKAPLPRRPVEAMDFINIVDLENLFGVQKLKDFINPSFPFYSTKVVNEFYANLLSHTENETTFFYTMVNGRSFKFSEGDILDMLEIDIDEYQDFLDLTTGNPLNLFSHDDHSTSLSDIKRAIFQTNTTCHEDRGTYYAINLKPACRIVNLIVSTNIHPRANKSEVPIFRMCLIYAIIKEIPINFIRIILKNMLEFSGNPPYADFVCQITQHCLKLQIEDMGYTWERRPPKISKNTVEKMGIDFGHKRARVEGESSHQDIPPPPPPTNLSVDPIQNTLTYLVGSQYHLSNQLNYTHHAMTYLNQRMQNLSPSQTDEYPHSLNPGMLNPFNPSYNYYQPPPPPSMDLAHTQFSSIQLQDIAAHFRFDRVPTFLEAYALTTTGALDWQTLVKYYGAEPFLGKDPDIDVILKSFQ